MSSRELTDEGLTIKQNLTVERFYFSELLKYFVKSIILHWLFQVGTTKSYRLEEIPKDQEELQEGEILVPVAHFSKEIFSTFGSPFLILLVQGDTVGSVKQKIQEKLGVSFTRKL